MAQPVTYTVTASARVDAPPQRVYDIIRDYHKGHPSILPKQFSNMRVEAGGMGAGTRIRFDVTVLGQTQHFVAVVSEPEPGRVLVEKNLEPHDSVTRFIVAPEDEGRAATVTFETLMPGRPGITGTIERFVTRRVMRSIYADELRLLQLRATERG
jgi:polyketide cyclase/dehydrase/lipid transport protein